VLQKYSICAPWKYFSPKCPFSIGLHVAAAIGGGVIWYWGLRRIAQGGQVPKDLQVNTDLKGKIAVITGGNTGIGKETAVQLAQWGAKVVIACRDKRRGAKAVEDITKNARIPNDGKCVEVMELDLASLQSVKDFANEVSRKGLEVSILVNNAGVMVPPFLRTEDGYELQFGTNHLGHFLLTNLLLDNLKRNNARIITVSSLAHRMNPQRPHGKVFTLKEIESVNESNYSKSRFYSISKMSNVLFTMELHRRLQETAGTTAKAYCLHPGVIYTNLMQHLGPVERFIGSVLSHLFLKTAKSGAQTSLYLCAASDFELVPGGYYADCKHAPTRPPMATLVDMSKELWEFSEKAVEQWL